MRLDIDLSAAHQATRTAQTAETALYAIYAQGGADEARTLVGALAQLRADVDLAVHQAVEHARAEGLSWQAVADALGVSKQTAHERYGRPRAAAPAEKITEPMF